jgi:hypothetical protein
MPLITEKYQCNKIPDCNTWSDVLKNYLPLVLDKANPDILDLSKWICNVKDIKNVKLSMAYGSQTISTIKIYKYCSVKTFVKLARLNQHMPLESSMYFGKLYISDSDDSLSYCHKADVIYFEISHCNERIPVVNVSLFDFVDQITTSFDRRTLY